MPQDAETRDRALAEILNTVQAITETLDDMALMLTEIHEFNKKLAEVLDQLGSNPMLQSMIGPLAGG